jgi:hypothetical protein
MAQFDTDHILTVITTDDHIDRRSSEICIVTGHRVLSRNYVKCIPSEVSFLRVPFTP